MLVKIALVAFVTIQLVSAQPIGEEKDAQILRSSAEVEELPQGKFRYGFQTTNGITAEARGQIKNPEAQPEDQILQIQGSYSYIDANGQPVAVEYTADENGFVPKNIPVAPVPTIKVAPIVAVAPKPVVVPVTPRVTLVQQPVQPIQHAPLQFVVNPFGGHVPVGNYGRNYVVYNPYFGQNQLTQGHYNPYNHYNPYPSYVPQFI